MKKKKHWVAIALPILIFAFSLLFTLDKETILLSLLSICGVLLCRSIVSYMMRNDDPLARMLCSDKGIFSCDEVLTSPAAKVYKKISWGDIGVVYFSALSLFILFAAVAGHWQEAAFVLLVPCSLAFTGSFVSIWYQGRVIGKWCKLCLTVIAVLWLQEWVLAAFFLTPGRGNALLAFLHDTPLLIRWTALFILCLALAASWFVIKPLISSGKEAQDLRLQLRRWKRSPSLFMNLLRSQVSVSDISPEGDFVLGADTARMKIIAVLSLYCPSCKKNYQELIKLLGKFDKDIQVIIRIRHPRTGKRPDVVPYLLAWYSGAKDQQRRQEVFATWFDTMDIAKCQEKLGFVQPQDHTGIAQSLEAWFVQNNIRQTPSIFFNLLPLPEPFLLTDLDLLIPGLRSRVGVPDEKKPRSQSLFTF